MIPAAAGTIGPAVRWLVTDRSGGVSRPPYDGLNLGAHVGDDPVAVAANRGLVAARVGVAADRLVTMRSVHGAAVAVVDGPGEEIDGVDALVTDRPGLALLAQGADCVPVLLADPGAGVVAAVHAGWRGVLADVVGATLASMGDLGADAGRVHAVIGPAICGRCYTVAAERREEVARVNPAAASTGSGDVPALDLRAGLEARLRAAGVSSTRAGGCTAEDPRWFSFRRDGRTGRQAGVVLLVAGTGDVR